ncbi:MAG: PD40 domain-containing protein [Blastocatellia bacterium]|nr:PD40 domain-containing protein [Blastocatellia bacterium]
MSENSLRVLSPANGDVLPRVLEFGAFRLDVEKRLLWRDTETVPLTPKAFEVLLALVRQHGQVVTKDQLMASVWPESVVEENSLNVHVSALRKVFGEKPQEHRFIVTVPGRGYQFVADVRETFAVSELGVLHANAGQKTVEHKSTVTQGDLAKDRRKNRSWWVAILLALSALGVLGFWLAGNRGRARDTSAVSRTIQITTWSGLDFYPSISPDGNTVAFSSDRTGGFELYVKQLISGAREVQLTSDGGQNFEPAFSPDGSLIAFYSKKRGGIWIIPTTGGAAKQLTEFGSHPAWAPDSSLIAFQSDVLFDLGFNVSNAFPPSTIWLVSVATGELQQLTQAGNPAGGHGAPSWSPDGKRIAFDSSDTGVASIWSVTAEGDDLKKLSGELRNAADVIYGPDNKSIYFVTDRGDSIQQLRLTRTGDPVGEPSKVFDASGSRIRQISISANSKRIVYSALSTSGDIWATPVSATGNSADNNATQLTQGKNTRNSWPAFSPDGRKILYLVYSVGASFQLWLMDADGKNKSELTTDAANASWFPDGKRIGFAGAVDNRAAFWSMTIESRKKEKLFDFDEYIHYTRLSPDGKQVAFNLARSGTLNIWVTSTDSHEQKQITFDKEMAAFAAWSPDGKWIAFEIKRGQDNNVCIVPSDGGEPIQLTNDKGKSWPYGWSPDGDKVLFAGERDGIWNVYWVSRSTKKQKQLTNFTKVNAYVRYPSWSPLGQQIVYEYAETTGNIWMADLK